MFIKTSLKIGLSLGLFMALTSGAYASTTFTSVDDQNYAKNTASSDLPISTITEDSQTPLITASNDIRIQIPDEIKILFDANRSKTEIQCTGTAVSGSKVDAKPAISFEDGDKTMVIPVAADFSAGDTLTISNVFVEGFNAQTDTGAYLLLIYDPSQSSIKNNKSLSVYASTNSDTSAPDAPSTLVLTQTSNSSIELTWQDPVDLDLTSIQVLRGVDPLPISGTTYATVLGGVEAYEETGLTVGETVHYIIRASDGLNLSANTEEVTLTLVDLDTATTTTATTSDTSEEDTGAVDDTTETATTDTTTTTSAPVDVTFTDELPSWAEVAITALAEAGVVTGNPDGSFAPNNNLNRAEAATMLWRVLDLGDPTGADAAPFTDVALNEWYTDYVASLKGLSLVSGNPDGTYQPGENINRAEFLQLAMNVFDYLNPTQEDIGYELTSLYADLDISAWYAMTVSEASARGFVEGSACDGATYSGTCFNAASAINRAEASQILYNMFGATL